MQMTAMVPPGTIQLQLCQQQVQQWKASLDEYRRSTAAAELPLLQDPQWQAMLGAGALYAYSAAAADPSGGLAAASQPSSFAAQQPAAGLPATGLPPPAGGSAQRARAVTFFLPGQSKAAAESASDGTSPTDFTQVSEGAVTPGAAAGAQQAGLLSDPAAAAAAAAYGALSDTPDVQADAGRASNKRKASSGQGALSAQSKGDDDAKLRRKQSNRESARRSRQRKEEEEREFKQRLATCEAAVDNLRGENGVLKRQVEQMTAIIDRLNQDRTALAAQVRNLGGEVRAELVTPIAIPLVPAMSDMTAVLQQPQQSQLQAMQPQSLTAGVTQAGVVAGIAGTFGLHHMPAVTTAAAAGSLAWQPAGTFNSGIA